MFRVGPYAFCFVNDLLRNQTHSALSMRFLHVVTEVTNDNIATVPLSQSKKQERNFTSALT